MNNVFKRLVSAALAASLAISMSAVVFADEVVDDTVDTSVADEAKTVEIEVEFTDMPDDWRTSAIKNAVANGLISGMGDGTVAPDSPITRAQMAAIIVRALGAKEEADISMFADVSTDAWYYKELSKAVYMKAFSGDGSNMNPENNITFQECFTVLSRVFGLENRVSKEQAAQALVLYSDGNSVADWAVQYYGAIVSGGYWSGGEEMLLTPTDYITRGEFAVVMDNLVKLYISEPGTVTELPEGNVVVRCDDVVLDGIKHVGDLIVGDGVSAEKISLKDIDVKGRLVFRGCTTPGMVDVLDKEGNVIGTKLSYTTNGCEPTGYASDIQLIVPYLSIGLSELNYDIGHCSEGSIVRLGNIGATN